MSEKIPTNESLLSGEIEKTKDEGGEMETNEESDLQYANELKDINDTHHVSEWIKKEIESLVSRRGEALFGYNFEEKMQEITDYIAEKKDLSRDSMLKPQISSECKTTYNEFNEGVINGTIKFMNEVICRYGSADDGWGAGIDEWDEDALEKAVEKYLAMLNEEEKNR